ncbi:MAG: tetratricopeptide repeat-containing sensor histidine kinase [Melioribacteraceae bacterium]|nr:tetratricopeptide repeat-containing sensor histidine kinase [Melioribacteraceae bacterium]MCF8354048.1 tetratricopeptide repeat-containing sensor histidine kinase [Melioribacteraceae bacterium]MCF8392271.1 tetratricopeptide repeat-containing sensor histidine kinase [Melioribacteraceae bacterium]MCF8417603.1 tetratricopeptide repeat-containing sensor histidine kinase [Melioribacteraceae bacterium]
MKKKLSVLKFLFLFLFLLIEIPAQEKIDSIMERISGLPDTSRITELNGICWNYRSKNPLLAMEAGKNAVLIGNKIKNKVLLATTHNYLGVVYRNIGDFDSAIVNYENALAYSTEAGDSVQIAYSYNNIGGIHRLKNHYTLALENIFKALEIFENLKMDEGIAYCTINISIIYRKQHNYSKALDYLNYTLKIREELEDSFGYTLTLNHIAEVYYEQELYNEAFNYYKILEVEYGKLNDKKGIATVYGGYGGVYYFKKDYEKALNYRLKALELNKEINNYDGIIINHNNLGLVYAAIGEFNKARDHLYTGLALSKKKGMNNAEIEAYKYLSTYFETVSKFDSALIYFKKYTSKKDSVLAEENLMRVAELEVKYQSEKKEKENQLLSREKEQSLLQRNHLLIIVFLSFILIGILFYRYISNQKAKRKLDELNKSKDRIFSIISHDLKNPFNSLLGYSALLIDDFDSFSDSEKVEAIREIQSSSKKLLTLVENLLEWSRTQNGLLSFNPDIIDTKDIIEKNVSLLEQFAKSKNIQIEILNIDEANCYCDENMLNSILRNLITNAIKFTAKNGEIKIDCINTNNKIEINVIDNGIGIPKNIIEKILEKGLTETRGGTNNESGSGIGLMLVNEFVRKNGGRLFIESNVNKGSKFTVVLPAAN